MNTTLLHERNIDSFLKLGYFLDVEGKIDIEQPELSIAPNELNLEDISTHGSNLFKNIINEKFKNDSKHLIPLSGGFDSRFILGNLMEFTPSENIETFTFGVPGTFDFEIGRKLSQKLGIKNHVINLNNLHFTEEILRDASNKFNNQILLFFHPNFKELEGFRDYQWWSGYLGGEIAGSHYLFNNGKQLNDLKIYFLEKNSFVRSMNLTKNGIQNLTGLVEIKNYGANVTQYENIDFTNRQTKYIRPQLFPNGFDVYSPFASKKWINFFLNIPQEYRENLKLYKSILLKNNYELFNFPTKSELGIGLDATFIEKLINRGGLKLLDFCKLAPSVKQRNINYFDFNFYLRNKRDFQDLNRSLIENLKNRKILYWLDIEKIWNSHLNNNGNYGDAIQIFSSLEIILRNLEEEKN